VPRTSRAGAGVFRSSHVNGIISPETSPVRRSFFCLPVKHRLFSYFTPLSRDSCSPFPRTVVGSAQVPPPTVFYGTFFNWKVRNPSSPIRGPFIYKSFRGVFLSSPLTPAGFPSAIWLSIFFGQVKRGRFFTQPRTPPGFAMARPKP